MRDSYYSIAIIALILMVSCLVLMIIMPFEARSEMRGIFAVVLGIQLLFDFIIALLYIFKAQEKKNSVY